MRGGLIAFVAVALLCGNAALANVIGVTVEVDEPAIDVGERETLICYAQVMAPFDAPDNGIFGWDVSVRIDNPALLSLDVTTVDKTVYPSGWTSIPSTSSSGTPVPWGIEAIYDTEEFLVDVGVLDRVALFSVEYEGLSKGVASLAIEADFEIGADFLTWHGDVGADYGVALAPVEIVPEPATLCLLAVGSLSVIRRRR